MTLLIQAHPEEEFERLAKAVLAMPINNPDEKKERFPKELSRRLFPCSGDDKVRERLETAISLHADVELPKRSSKRESSVPPSHKPSINENTALPPAASRKDSNVNGENAPPPLVPSNIERERKPYSSIRESAIDDTNPKGGLPSTPIERERQPYSAQPGLGKQYEDDLKAREMNKPRSEPTATRHGRSDSTATRPRPIPSTGQAQPGSARPMDMPKPEIHQHHRAPSNARRRPSPSFSNEGRRSDGDLRGYQPEKYPSTFQAGSVPNAESFDEEARRYARDRAERARRQADEDARSYGDSPNNRARHDRGVDSNGPVPHRGSYLSNNEEDYYRANGRANGNGYDYQQPYGGPVYR